ncbi:MAG: DNA double-strand break repair protein Mre11 [Halobacteriota archaeon]
MTRVIHTGDTHIGYRQYHSPERRQDFLDAFESVIDDAIADDVDAVVHAGDLFHDRRPELGDLLGTLSTLRRLDDAAIPFLAVVGNHESTRSGQWLDLFERLGLTTRLGPEPVTIGETAFYGLDHVPPSRRDELTYQFEPSTAAHDVLVSHGLFTPFAHADWDTAHVLEESTVDFEAVLLGDNHVPGVEQVDGTWITYCGSTERASASETAARGYNVVEFDEGVDIRRRSIDTRPFVFVEVDLAEGEGIDRVREQVGQHDVTDAVVIVRIDGDGEPVTPADVESYALDRGALIARVRDDRDRAAESGADLGVEFADPDAAVDDRVRNLGLSTSARAVDDAVRSATIADSNVRETVKANVRDHLEDGLAAFEPAPEDATSDSTGSVDEPIESVESSGSAVDSSASSGSTADRAAESRSAESTDRSDESSDSTSTHGTDSNTDGQTSMGEYL